MIIPTQILPQLTPIAAKLYLTLLALADSKSHPLAATAPMKTLTQLTTLSERSCNYALRQLRDLQLIHRIRRHRHDPCTYFLTIPSNPQPVAAHTVPDPQPAAPLPPPTRTPMHLAPTSNPQPHAGHPPQNPLLTPKIPAPHSAAALLNQILDPASPLACDNPALLAHLYSQLTESEKSLILAQAQSTLQESRT